MARKKSSPPSRGRKPSSTAELHALKGHSTFAPSNVPNPGRGVPNAPNRTTYIRSPEGGWTQFFGPTATEGIPAYGGGIPMLPSSGYSLPAIDPETGIPNYLTGDYLAPDGSVLRERQGLSGDLPEVAVLLEHMNENRGYWESQVSRFARDHPVITGAAVAVSGAAAVRAAQVYSGAISSTVTAARSSMRGPAGFDMRPRTRTRFGGSGARSHTIPFPFLN